MEGDGVNEATLSDGERVREHELAPGARVGRYTVIDQLGKGGMGVVYMAYDPELDRRIALKVLTTQPERNGASTGPHSRLQREAQAMAQLSHPHVVAVYDVGTVTDRLFIAMEYVEGQNLRSWLKKEDLSYHQKLAVLLQAGLGLSAAHRAGLIHRDFKPENVMVDKEGRARVLDFGLARAKSIPTEIESNWEPDMGSHSSESLLRSPLTRMGAIVGTPAYMSPEQHLGDRVDEQSDQFSFCVTLFEALYGQRPFAGNNVKTLMANITRHELLKPKPGSHTAPLWLSDVLSKGLLANPQQRYHDMQALLDALARDPEQARRQRLQTIQKRIGVLVGLLLITLVPLGIGWYQKAERSLICKQTQHNLQGVWDAQTRQQMLQVFRQSDHAFAQETSLRVAQNLTLYAQDWLNMSKEACEATRLHQTQSEQLLDLRMACLFSRRRDLKALTALLLQADKQIAGKAVEASSNLAPIRECADIESILHRSRRVKPPTGENVKKRVEFIRSRLAAVWALYETGQYGPGQKKAQETLLAAKQIGYKPIEAETLFWLGRLQEGGGAYQQAKQTLTQAHVMALKHKYDEIAIRSANWLAFMVSHHLKSYAEGVVWGRVAAGLLSHVQVAPSVRAEWHNNQGVAVMSGGELPQSITHLQEAVRIRKSLYSERHYLVAQSLTNLGSVYYMMNEYEKAVISFQQARSTWIEVVGRKHPETATTVNNMSMVYSRLGQQAKALEFQLEAMELRKQILGADHPIVSGSYRNLGAIYLALDQLDQALLYQRRALEMKRRIYGQQHLSTSYDLDNLGQTYLQQGRYPESYSHFLNALQIKQQSLSEDHPDLARSLLGMGDAAFANKQVHKARALLNQALQLCLTTECATDLVSAIRFSMGRVLWATTRDFAAVTELIGQARKGFASKPYWKVELGRLNAWSKKNLVSQAGKTQ